MRRTLKKLGIVAAATLVCPLSAFADPPWTFQASDVVNIEGINTEMDIPARVGAATLRRNKNRLEGRVMANTDTVGFPYTIWWVVFNNPEYCEGPFINDADGNPLTRCNGPDTRNEAVNGGVFYAGASISASTDKINMMGYTTGVINETVETLGGVRPDGECCRGLLAKNNGFGAEIHLVVARHGGIGANGSWVSDLTRPQTNNLAAVFLPVEMPEGDAE